MPPRKRKTVEKAEGDASPQKRSARKKEPVVKETYTDDAGWTIRFPSLIYKRGDAEPNEKIAAFDLDGTLIKQKSRGRQPVDADDWKCFNKEVTKKLEEINEDGYKIVIFSNQNGIKSALEGKMATKVKQRIDNFLAEVAAPVQVFLASQKDDLRKPETGMWTFFTENCNGGVEPDLEQSYFVGDAAGRDNDFADSDKKFAVNVGLEFKLPEDVFGKQEGKKQVTIEPKMDGEGNYNEELTKIFSDLADHYTTQGGNGRFKGYAFRKVSLAVGNYSEKITEDNVNKISKVPGVGQGSMTIIKEFVSTGKVAEHEQLFGDGGSSKEAEDTKAEEGKKGSAEKPKKAKAGPSAASRFL